MLIGQQSYVFGPGQKVFSKPNRIVPVCEHGHSFVPDFVTIAIRAMKHTRAIKLAEARTTWRQIPQTSSEQQSPRVENSFVVTDEHAKVFGRNCFHGSYARLDDQPRSEEHTSELQS